MKKIHFLICLHNHQPVGNLEQVVDRAFRQAYRPFLQLLHRHPAIRITLHFSGTLLEWMMDREPGLCDLLQELVGRGQVELLGGGMYEPVFSVIPERDVIGQLQLMNTALKTRFGVQPAGAWIPERVWDPVLPRLLRTAGLSATLLDDTHFLHTGLAPEQIRGYYVTERDGQAIAVFPIDKKLRYLIPFEPPEKTIEHLLYLASDDGSAVTCGDDGEKFGMWPGTQDWVYGQGWLESFFQALEKNRHRIRLCTLSEYRTLSRPQGLVYLPTLSYDEMMQWALPADAVARYDCMVEHLQAMDLYDKYAPFLSGGHWCNFLSKYPEGNRMHKKMLLVSRRLAELQDGGLAESCGPKLESARRELYRGQCNAAYWHGLFGGIYLTHLRHAAYTHLLNAEQALDRISHGRGPWLDTRVTDFGRDFSRDILVSGESLNAYVSPAAGGALFELDYKPRSLNITNTLARRMEGYHRRIRRANGTPVPDAPPQEALFENVLAYDWYERHCFIDHFFGPETTLEGFSHARYPELGNFIGTEYELQSLEDACPEATTRFMLQRDGHIMQNDVPMPVRLEKTFSVSDARQQLRVDYTIENTAACDQRLWFGVELNFALRLEENPLVHYCIKSDPEQQLYVNHCGSLGPVGAFEIKDDWNGFAVAAILSPETELWLFPLNTVSQSETGFEKNYQGSCVLLHWRLELPPEARRTFSVTLQLCHYPAEKNLAGNRNNSGQEETQCRNYARTP